MLGNEMDMFSRRGPSKGGQNPPNTSTERPPAPGGSGGCSDEEASHQETLALLAERDAEIKRLKLKCKHSLANNLCPDHRDKQAGKSCLACEIERLKDHPDADCTDAAHPAWWRGHEHTVSSMCAEINKILDGDDAGAGVSTEPWESVRRRLLRLNAEIERMSELLSVFREWKIELESNPGEQCYAAMAHTWMSEAKKQQREVERLEMELRVLKEFRETDRKALQAFSEWDGDSDLWAAMLTQRDEATQRSLTCCFCNQPCESLEALKAHGGECREHPLWKDAVRFRSVVDLMSTQDVAQSHMVGRLSEAASAVYATHVPNGL